MPSHNPLEQARIFFLKAEELRKRNELPQAMNKYLEAAKRGHLAAIMPYAEINLSNPDVRPNPQIVLRLLDNYAKASTGYVPPLFYFLYARALQLGATQPDKQLYAAIRLNYEEAVKGNNTKAMVSLGNMYRDGIGGPRRIFKALSLYAMAVDLGDNTARKVLNQLLFNSHHTIHQGL